MPYRSQKSIGRHLIVAWSYLNIALLAVLLNSCATENSENSYFQYDQPFIDTLSSVEIVGNSIQIEFVNRDVLQQWNFDCDIRDRNTDSFLFRIDGYKGIQQNGVLSIVSDEFLPYDMEQLKIQFHLMNESFWYMKNCEVWRFVYYIDTSGQVKETARTTSGRFTRFDYNRYVHEKSKTVKLKVEKTLDSLSCGEW